MAVSARIAALIILASGLAGCQATLGTYTPPAPAVVYVDPNTGELYARDPYPGTPYGTDTWRERRKDPYYHDPFRGPPMIYGPPRGVHQPRSPFDRPRYHGADPWGWRTGDPFLDRRRAARLYSNNGRCDDPRYETSNSGRAPPGTDEYDCSRYGDGLKGRYR